MQNQQLSELRPNELFGSAKLHPKPLGLIWIKSDYPTLSLGLEKMLGAKAHVYRGQKPPVQASPSVVIYCPNGEDSVSQIEQLKAQVPDIPCLVFSLQIDLQAVRAAIKAGAQGYIHAGMSPEQIARALLLALEGEVVLPRELLKTIVDKHLRPEPPDLSGLRPRQLEILELVVEGLSNGEIAQRLWVTESTVKQHLRGAYKILGVKSRIEAARAFRQAQRAQDRCPGDGRNLKAVVHPIR